jgi:hypothetical protein
MISDERDLSVADVRAIAKRIRDALHADRLGEAAVILRTYPELDRDRIIDELDRPRRRGWIRR